MSLRQSTGHTARNAKLPVFEAWVWEFAGEYQSRSDRHSVPQIEKACRRGNSGAGHGKRDWHIEKPLRGSPCGWRPEA
jgi:hypothetical protein